MKKLIIGFILGGILFGCIGIYAASYYAKDVSYEPTDASWEVTNVNEAINSLYDNATSLKKLGDAEASDISKGKTAVIKGELITGTKIGGAEIVASGNGSKTITLENGVYYGISYRYCYGGNPSVGFTDIETTLSSTGFYQNLSGAYGVFVKLNVTDGSVTVTNTWSSSGWSDSRSNGYFIIFK